MKQTLLLVLLACYGIFTATTYAPAQESKSSKSLSLEECVALGVANSKSLHSSLMRVQAANAKSSETNSGRLPKLTAGGTYTRLSKVPPFEITLPPSFGANNKFSISPSIFDNYGAKLTLQQPLFTGFKIESGAEMAEYNAYATGEDYKKDQAELEYNIKNAYWSLFKAQEVKKVLDENISQVEAHLRDVQNLLAQGMATNNEELKVQVQLSNVKLMQLDMANNVRLAMVNLNYQMNQPLATEITLTSSPSMEKRPYALASLDRLISQAIEKRSEIKGMEYRVKASEAAVTFARSGWYPQVYLVGNYYYSRPNQRYQPIMDEFNDSWDASISLSFDLWNWGQTSDQTQQAKAQLEQANDGLQQLRDGIAMEVTSNYLSLSKSFESIGLAEKGVTQAEENYRITNEKFKAGIASNSDLLDAEVALLQAKTNYTTSLVDYKLAQARLEKSLGETE